MAVSFATYERVALEDGDGLWELVCGKLRERPQMSQRHNSLAYRLMAELLPQLDDARFELRMNAPTLRVSSGTYLIPDVAVVPNRGLLDEPGLENYETPLAFVAEIWSLSTGDYDVDTKFPEYKNRRDAEIWRVDPRDRSVTAWSLQRDGLYSEARQSGGKVPIPSLPGVYVNLDRLFR